MGPRGLGALSPGIPGPGTRWGLTFSVELVGVVGLFLLSVARTLGVVALVARQSTSSRIPPPLVDRLRASYAGTATYLLAVVLLAEVLAHG